MKTKELTEQSKIKKIKIVLVEDHESVRKGYRQVLEEEPNIKVVGEASNGKEMFELLPSISPDIIILDIEMPQMNGNEALQKLTKHYPLIKTIILSGHYGNIYAFEFFNKGARSYLSKSCSINELTKAINTVYNLGYYMNSAISDIIVSRQMQKIKLEKTFNQLALTEKESMVLKLICEGVATKQMVNILKIDINTINFHKKNIYRKTKINSIGPLVKYAIINGYTELE